jgi:hypothetical protein
MLADTSNDIKVAPLLPTPIIVTSFNKRNAAVIG